MAMQSYFPRILSRPVQGARSILVLSDIEMGEPGPYDDFPHDGFLADLILSYVRPPYDGMPVDLVLNGDILDLLKTSIGGNYTRYVTADVALQKIQIVLDSHPGFMEALKAFGSHGSGNKRIFFIAGNHDTEILFPEVQRHLRALLADVPHFEFPGLQLTLGPVYFEHGHQRDTIFAMDPEQLFVEFNGEKILRLPWGTCALLDAAMPLRPLLYHHDRLRPRFLIFERMPKIRKVIVKAFRRYWMRDYLWESIVHYGDPTRELSWKMIREIVFRLYTADPDVVLSDDLAQLLKTSPDLEVVSIGHLHTPSWQMHARRYLVQTGCLRDEFEIHHYDDKLVPIDKSYGEILLVEGHVEDVRLFHVQGPERPPGTYPGDIFALSKRVPKLLKEGCLQIAV